MKNERGITLISLMITIILMGIVAGIVIANVMDSGMIALDMGHNVADITNETLNNRDSEIEQIKGELESSYR